MLATVSSGRLILWDLQKRTAEVDIGLPVRCVYTIAWLSNDFLLLDGRDLIDCAFGAHRLELMCGQVPTRCRRWPEVGC